MERETEKITTPVGKVDVTVKKWLIGGEKLELTKIKPEEATEWMIKNIIVSPSLEDIKNLHGKDFDFVLNEMLKVITESTWTDKKKD